MKRRNGREDLYWVADEDVAKAGYQPKTMRIFHRWPDDIEKISAICVKQQAEMIAWTQGTAPTKTPFAMGSLGFLAHQFETDEESPFRDLRESTQSFYRHALKNVSSYAGGRQLNAVTGRDVRKWHKVWVEKHGLRGGYACIQAIRRIVHYGCETGDPSCIRLAAMIERMEFKAPGRRTKRPSYEMIEAFRPVAIADGRPSQELALMLQFELSLRQKDVIGEWVKAGDGSREGIMDGQWRWQWGLTWNHIDGDWLLKKPTSKSNGSRIAEHDLKAYPSLLALLQAVPAEKRIGPIVLDERANKPYRQNHFSRTFRKIARAAGWPDDVWNMDSRAGAVSEAFEAGAQAADVMTTATHTQMSTTMIYNRGKVVQSARVAELRQAKRLEKQAENKAR
jgi:hypothetical protein